MPPPTSNMASPASKLNFDQPKYAFQFFVVTNALTFPILKLGKGPT